MKISTKLLQYGFLISLLLISCSKDGEVGPIGPSGTSGIDGIDGIDGTNGVDGNANVRAFMFDDVDFSGGESFVLDMTGVLTKTVIERDVVLVYLRVGNESLASRGRVFSLPSRVLGSFPDDIPTQYVDFWLDDSANGQPERIIVHTRSIEDTTLFPDQRTPVEWVKVVIIEASSFETVTGKNMPSTKQVLAELEEAGVDVTDYYSVCTHYGICKD